MTSTDNDRRILHSALEAACGPRPAEILMEHLPPAGWRDLVTKDDLVLARSGIQLEIEKLRTELGSLQARFKKKQEEPKKD